MSTAPSDPRSASHPAEHPDEPDAATIQHVTVDRDGVAVCTMFPANCDDADVTTEWLTASSDAYCSLEDAR
ncbi:DUF7511 domain-containing protein [Natrarchaeobaculum aegyptiacum]|uniref:DUF7511 domain-containing protein n=1 Tax=Natrarchaeobaculum aegyptiacum TaxID=745377 RepID=A0A2Z2HPW8_9EURY|nr:hypothetical protein [Natrarchaeobaculum aegyptiacum]ARS89089.1 hypothetical protein B1756_04495 [Natrarchaeobaculum aegyptiacum]